MSALLARFNASPAAARRLLWLLASLALVALSVLLLQASERRQTQAIELATRNAWRTSQSGAVAGNAATSPTPDAVIARFAMRSDSRSVNAGGGGGAPLAWQVASPGDLRSSLAALSASGVRLAQVNVTRNGAGFAVTAERAP